MPFRSHNVTTHPLQLNINKLRRSIQHAVLRRTPAQDNSAEHLGRSVIAVRRIPQLVHIRFRKAARALPALTQTGRTRPRAQHAPYPTTANRNTTVAARNRGDGAHRESTYQQGDSLAP